MKPFRVLVGYVLASSLCLSSAGAVAQVITEFTDGLSDGARPMNIVAGPDGNLWFTEPNGKVGRITTSGDVTEFVFSNPYDEDK